MPFSDQQRAKEYYYARYRKRKENLDWVKRNNELGKLRIRKARSIPAIKAKMLERARELSKRPSAKLKANAKRRKYQKDKPDIMYRIDRKKHLKAKYGITEEQYDSMLAEQGGVCAICREVDRYGKKLAVDHDHVSGLVRGLLCSGCNLSIGNALDKISILREAINYLTKHGKV